MLSQELRQVQQRRMAQNQIIRNQKQLPVTINRTEQVRHTTEALALEVHPEHTGLLLHPLNQVAIQVVPHLVVAAAAAVLLIQEAAHEAVEVLEALAAEVVLEVQVEVLVQVHPHRVADN